MKKVLGSAVTFWNSWKVVIIWSAVVLAILIAIGVRYPVFKPVLSCVRWDAWPPPLTRLSIIQNLLTFFAYVWIPVSLGRILRRRKDIPRNGILICFGVFILSCGFGHLADALTIQWPYYWLSNLLGVITASVSVTTAFITHRAIPFIVNLPSYKEVMEGRDQAIAAKADLQEANAELQAARDKEIAANIALQAANAELQAERDNLQKYVNTIRELEIPVQKLDTGILHSPIVGHLDSRRVDRLMEAITSRVAAEQASVAILDVAGVRAIDTAVAEHLLKIEKVLGLMGCACIITGVSSAVAQTVVALGVTLPERTEGTLMNGIQAALRIRDRSRAALRTRTSREVK